MDYIAILEALDARTLQAFKAWGETFAAGMKSALDERDAMIAAQAEQIRALDARLALRPLIDKDAIISEALAETQKQVREQLASLSVPTYRGVFDRDVEYKAGDFVTYGGSMWHCNGKDLWLGLDEHPVPGKSAAWTLAVKCGRDGRDAKPEAAE